MEWFNQQIDESDVKNKAKVEQTFSVGWNIHCLLSINYYPISTCKYLHTIYSKLQWKPCLFTAIGLLICTLISENQGLEKLRSVSNPRKISGSANFDFFWVWHLDFFQVYSINTAFFSGWTPKNQKNSNLKKI